jgi:hypothetical protein
LSFVPVILETGAWRRDSGTSLITKFRLYRNPRGSFVPALFWIFRGGVAGSYFGCGFQKPLAKAGTYIPGSSR